MDKKVLLLITVAALGYFVDIYDLALFNIVKRESLVFLFPDFSATEVTQTGIFLFNMQMTGMMAGGLLWGILGDKKGRVQVLFGSILLYSLANLVNAFVTTVPAYAAVRFIAGVGLAGELGAGITLISETMDRQKRGIGTMIVVTFGALGAVFAGLVGIGGGSLGLWLESFLPMDFPAWRVAYLVGGLLGLTLLILRLGVYESGMYAQIRQEPGISRGDLRLLLGNRQNVLKYLSCIFLGVPIWYTVGLLISNSEEIFGPALNTRGRVINGKALMYCYIGLSAGDLISGVLSQWFKSRKKVVFGYLLLTAGVIAYFLYFARGISTTWYYGLCFLIGMLSGYWAIFVTIASEQFGTNIRSTVTNTVPNFVRGSVPLIMGAFLALSPGTGSIHAAMITGLGVMALAFLSWWYLEESFHKDLDYTEATPVRAKKKTP